MKQRELKKIIAEQMESDPEIKKLLRQMVDSLESIDTSIDFVAAGLTGGTARGIDIAQRRAGRLNPSLTSRAVPPPPPSLNEKKIGHNNMDMKTLKKMIAEELNKLRTEAMPLPLDDEDDDRFSPEQREQDARLENPDLYYGAGDDDEDMSSRSVSSRLKDLLRDVEAGAAAVRAGEDYDFLNPDALKAAKAAMLHDPKGQTDEVEDAIYAKLYYEYFPEFLQEGAGPKKGKYDDGDGKDERCDHVPCEDED
jgi:hypothetical protein